MGGSSWQEKMHKAKRLHRPSLKNWECDGLYESFPNFVKKITTDPSKAYQSFHVNINHLAKQQRQQQHHASPHSTLPVVLDAKTLSPQDFFDHYEWTESPTPCVILNACASWPAIKRWSLQSLEQDDELLGRLYKCGEDDHGKSVKVKLRHFLKYLHTNRDDSPLYIFDSAFDEDRKAKRICLSDYQVPVYFADDLFRLISESRRPPYRWFLVGPERSGTTVHIDPLGTSAWNTLVHGQKRWVLFPPHVPKSIVKGKGLVHDDEDDEAVHYFMTILPRIKRKAASMRRHHAGGSGSSSSDSISSDYDGFACYEFTQNAGETVFIPTGWWHAVLNLTHTVGVTQNFCSPRNFPAVWIKTRNSRKKMAWKWLCQLDEHYPHLADLARQMNARDGFRMKYDPAEIKRRQQEEEERRRRKLQRTV
jgi:histone arginine demethylase JMJD6